MIWTLLQRAVAGHGAEIAVEEGERRLTYAALAERAGRIATTLAHAGLVPGSRVGILALNTSLFLEAYFAAAHAGLVLVPLNHRATPGGLRRVLSHAGARALLSDRHQAPFAAEVAEGIADLRHWTLGDAPGAMSLEDDLASATPQ